jgi:carbonic anhydrase/acetyltransferase-like protein (isoleucine patch superfamily)
VDGAEIVGPVRLEAGVVVRGGRIGPDVTLEHGARVEGCELTNTVVGHDAVLEGARLHDSLVGAHAEVRNVTGMMHVTHHSVIEGA